MSNSHIGASIEVSAKHVHDGKLHAEQLPKGTRVYITDVGVDPVADLISAARKVTDMGYQSVPHIPARRIESTDALESRLAGMVNEGGVQDILIIAGEADEQMGPFSETLAVLQTGLVDKLGIKHVAVGGHPEGNVAYSGRDVMEVLRDKIAFGAESDAEFRIATQFGFDGPKFVEWAKAVKAAGIEAPIHLGVAGPAKITTLIKYAAMCGVGNSLNFFKKRTSAIAQLATKHSPEDVVGPIEAAWADGSSNIVQLHVFPFGGLQASADWLTERGSFQFDAQGASVAMA
ncbi:MAG: methylenetetrahydrofolate reductase [Rhizobiaceae bacterium]|nr:methylenetetrahydrofolate reductase [Hyphomicrobiales bacterium]NRB30424.1 methylenetetrahydrofolate reductase [Rhizobiaceae bacterium]